MNDTISKCPSVYIVLVNYNGANDTLECIDSLSRLTFSNYSIVVVDNKSTDDSIIILNKEKDILNFDLICLDENLGFSGGNNVGIKYALKLNADFILLLNNDTIVEPNFIESLIEPFNIHNNCGITIGKIFYEGERRKIWYAGGAINKWTAKTIHFGFDVNSSKFLQSDLPKKVSFATGCCFLLSARTIEEVGLLNEDYFLYEEDTDYCSRVNALNLDIYYVPESIIYHKVSASTGRTSGMAQYYMVRNKFLFIQKNYKYKIIPYIYSILQFTYKGMTNKLQFRYIFWGIKDFYNKIVFKTEREFK